MIATGLHQDPHEHTTYYWRLKDHAAFLTRHGVVFDTVEPRMSRDFVLCCADRQAAAAAADRLTLIRSEDGQPLFEVDNRGTDLFVMLTWSDDITDEFAYRVGNELHRGLKNDVAFVAIKNGEHNGIGYLLDTGEAASNSVRIPLTALPQRICRALGYEWQLS